MPFFSLVRQRRRRARRLSVVRAVAAGWARLGDKSLFHQMVGQCQLQARGARRSQLSIRREWWDLGSMFRRPRSKTARQRGGNAAAPCWTRALCSAVRASGSWAIADHDERALFVDPARKTLFLPSTAYCPSRDGHDTRALQRANGAYPFC